MGKKLSVGVLFGGNSPEHQISLLSARNVIQALDPEKYDLLLIGIEKTGEWRIRSAENYLVNAQDARRIELGEFGDWVAAVPSGKEGKFTALDSEGKEHAVDVVIPILHGINGEDGTVQGVLKLAGIPFVGPGVLGAAIGMDKDVMKRLWRDGGLSVARFMTFHRSHSGRIRFSEVAETLGLPLFVKPASCGSSVGISKVSNEAEFERAIQLAFSYDLKILCEEAIEGREFECSVIGNEDPIVSLPGEIIPKVSFYTYEAKYIDEEMVDFVVPARVTPEELTAIQTAALKGYQLVCSEGMGRVDCFLRPNGEVILNEINTLPGLTNMSLFHQLWEASGMPLSKVLDRLIGLALSRHRAELTLKSYYPIDTLAGQLR
ncbi:MAG: D-alanine--D-alanine ligase A [Chlamydiae bacterium]|nr:D-alanine--D-alanine ligase A [Chlamydiota bacterium]